MLRSRISVLVAEKARHQILLSGKDAQIDNVGIDPIDDVGVEVPGGTRVSA